MPGTRVRKRGLISLNIGNVRIMSNARLISALLLLPVTVIAQGGPPEGREVTVESMIVEPTRLEATVEAVGTVLADASAALRAEVPGQIIERHFEEAQRVSSGDPLFSIEATVLVAEVNEAKANVEQSEAAYKRARELATKNLISGTDFDTARANYNVAVARLNSAQARLSKTVIRAPFDGFVGLRRINVGDYATVGQELVDVVRLDPLRVEFSVPETLLARVRPGQKINVAVGAFPGEVFAGEVTAVDPQIEVSGHSMAVRAKLPNPELKLRPGLFAQVSVTLAVKTDALMLPEEAIWPIGQEKTVYVIEDGVAKRRSVKLGERKPGLVEIVSGLSAGEEVVVAGQMKLFDGIAVRTITPMGGSR